MRKLILESFCKSDYCFFLALGTVFYIVIRQYIPYIDDLNYSFAYWKDADKRCSIESFRDIIDSQIYDYFNWNGRVIIHSVVQFCCSFHIGREFHFILTSLSFVMLMSGMTFAVRQKHLDQSIDKYILLLGILLFFPCLGQLFFGRIAFTANYLWPGAAFIWLYNYFNIIKVGETAIPLFKGILIILGSFIIAALNESFTIPFGAALFFYAFTHYKKLYGASICLLLGFLAGACIMILAPSNFQRQENANVTIMSNFIGLVKSKIFIQFIFINLGYLCVRGMRQFFGQIQRNIFFYSIAITSVLFATIIIYMGERQLYIVEYMMLLLVVTSITRWIKDKKMMQHAVKFLSCAYALIVSILLFDAKQDIKTAWQELENSISKSERGIAVARDLYKLCMDKKDNYIYSHYTDIGTLLQIVERPYWNSITFDYYTKGAAPIQRCILPASQEEIIKLISSENESSAQGIFYNAKQEYYVIRFECKDVNPVLRPTVSCHNDFSHTAYGKIKKLFGLTHQTTENLSLLGDLHHFYYDNTLYAIVYKGTNSTLSVK